MTVIQKVPAKLLPPVVVTFVAIPGVIKVVAEQLTNMTLQPMFRNPGLKPLTIDLPLILFLNIVPSKEFNVKMMETDSSENKADSHPGTSLTYNE